jgi:hypothetical protein
MLKDFILNHPVYCNAFLRGIEQCTSSRIRNYPSDMRTDHFKEWLKLNHPDLLQLNEDQLAELFKREHTKSKNQAISATNAVWEKIMVMKIENHELYLSIENMN